MFSKELYLICFVLFSCISLFSQDKSTELGKLGLRYARLSDSLYFQADSSLYYAKKALPILKKEGLMRDYIHLRCGLNYIYNKLNDNKALEKNSLIAYQLSCKYLSPQDEISIKALNNYAWMFRDLKQDYHKSLSLLEEAFYNLDTLDKSYLKGSLLQNIGSTFFILGDFKTAIIYYQNALNYYTLEKNRLHTKIADVHTELGRSYAALNHDKEAILEIQKALEIADTSSSISSSSIIHYRLHLAASYRRLGQLNSAKDILRPVLYWKNTPTNQKFDIWYNWTLIQLAIGNEKQVEKSINKIELFFASLGGIRSARYYHLQARYAWLNQNSHRALAYLEKSIGELYPDYGLNNFNESSLQNCLSPYELNKILRTKCQWLSAVNEAQSLEQSIGVYHQMSKLNDYAFSQYQSKESQLVLLADNKLFYEEALDVLFRLNRRSPNQKWAQEALFFIEKSKSTILLNELKRKAISGQINLPENYSNRVYSLRKELAYQRQLSIQIATDSLLFIQENDAKILDLERGLNQLEDSIRLHFPVFRSLSKLAPIRYNELKESIENNAFLINIFVGEKWVYVLGIHKKGLQWHRWPAKDFSNDKLVAYQALLKLNALTDYKDQAHKWYQQLVGSFTIPPNTNKLIIFSDSHLSNLPFSSLLATKNGELPSQLSYLIKKYIIHNAYSASVFVFQQQAYSSSSKILGVYPIFKGLTKYQADVEKTFQSTRYYQGLHLKGQAALKDGFLQQAPLFDVLYFATHARAWDSLHLEPSIDFYDAPLYLSELSNLDLKAQLAVLSACETGLGEFKSGEGSLSLARGFTYAGIPAVVTTLWSVPEGATMEIMDAFFKNLNTQLPKDLSLTNAQLDYLSSRNIPEAEKAPYYWAGIITLGNTKPVELKHKFLKGLPVRYTVIILVVLFFLKRTWFSTLE